MRQVMGTHSNLPQRRGINLLLAVAVAVSVAVVPTGSAVALPSPLAPSLELLPSPRHTTPRQPALVYPLLGTAVSSSFGNRKHPVLQVIRHHEGVDLAAPRGAPIRSITSGVVVYADPYGGYGNLVVVKHRNGMTSHYGHCDSFNVRTGQKVQAGQILGFVGSTGRVTGPHLHLEIRKDGAPLNPEALFPNLASGAEG